MSVCHIEDECLCLLWKVYASVQRFQYRRVCDYIFKGLGVHVCLHLSINCKYQL